MVEQLDPQNQPPSPHTALISPLLSQRVREPPRLAPRPPAAPLTIPRRELIVTVLMSGCCWIKQGD